LTSLAGRGRAVSACAPLAKTIGRGGLNRSNGNRRSAILPRMTRAHPELASYLNRLCVTFGADHIRTDPLGEVRRYTGADDLEVAGFLAAGLAFGRVASILAHLRDLWERLDHRPAALADGWSAAEAVRLRGFVHRWVRGRDVAAVMAALGRARRRHGSLRELFLAGYDPREHDLKGALSRFVNGLRSEVRLGGGRRAPGESSLPQGVRTFFADPERGGACKRLNLFARWMVRPDDGVDLGLFAPVRPDQLVIPLDTHVARLSRYLGLAERRTVDWRMAAEVTGSLRRLDGRDPVRYDFALSRLGILDACPRRLDPARCAACSLITVCRLGGNHRA
jgi:uncharacterized protein (TIGR02757 family)